MQIFLLNFCSDTTAAVSAGGDASDLQPLTPDTVQYQQFTLAKNKPFTVAGCDTKLKLGGGFCCEGFLLEAQLS
ncbi:MAG: hypothetical protein WC856_21190 [Methylococcaceae bacterium]|jgi:hypothetical protein